MRALAGALIAVACAVALVACDSGSTTTSTPPRRRAHFAAREVLAVLPPDTGPSVAVVVPGTNKQTTTADATLPSRDGRVRYAVGPVSMTNADVRTARAVDMQGIGWSVLLTMNRAGNRRLDELARVLYPKGPPQNGLAFVVNGVVQSSGAFQTPTFDGDVSITGKYTEAQARRLAASLNP